LFVYCPGGITTENALNFLQAGASHVIVTSFVFRDGSVDFDRLAALSALVGPDRLVIDLSCRKQNDGTDNNFYVVTNKWTKYTDLAVT
jgi:phosphoribosylformimino-5-aminoimidazole carboxamide ribotide isomerase